MPLAVEVEQLGKRYALDGTAPSGTLREAIGRRRLRPRDQGRSANELWALRDVSFSVEAGEVLGIIGRNGAGKSTLLKILARITQPTTGLARTRGRLGAILEVGTGFHEELSGRDNVFLAGAVLGMHRDQVRRQLGDIVGYAGVERFIDMPLKRYSSGMKLRLAFAVAAHLQPDVLIVDEVLAVGDAEFQQRCLGRMNQLHREGRTVLFVSHDLGAIARLCERTLWMDEGQIRFDGPTWEALQRYYASIGDVDTMAAEVRADPALPAAVTSVAVTDRAGDALATPVRGEPFSLHMQIEVRERVPALDVGFYLTDSLGLRVLEDVLRSGIPDSPLGQHQGTYDLRIDVPALLRADEYLVGIYVYSGDDWYQEEEPLRFRVRAAASDSDDGLRPAVRPALDWSVDPAEAPIGSASPPSRCGS
jgi:ABC-type polysaccharide/polyol phosphate transport system ATPase subunit